MTAETTAEVLIVGGGPAGASLGIELARAGRDVAIVEREAGPHDKVCGEFLSGEAIEMLSRLGLDAKALGAVPIDTVGVSRGRWRMERPLPFHALSLSRSVLDEALLKAAEASGARLIRGAAVQSLERRNGVWRARLPDGAVTARHAMVATGKHDLRGRPRPPGRHNDLIGFKTHLRLSPAARDRLTRLVEIALFPGGYAGLEPIEDGRANLCLVVGRRAFAELGGWDALFRRLLDLTPFYAEALAGADALFDRPLAISRIPYGLVQADANGAWLLGDQAAVIPSFAGEGVTLALHSARRAASHFLCGNTAAAYQAGLAAELRGQVVLATAFSRAIVRPTIQRLAPVAAPLALTWLARATRLRPRDPKLRPRAETLQASARTRDLVGS